MKKIIALLLSLMLIVMALFAFTACGETPPPECQEHIDNNGDGICDNEGCGQTLEKTPAPSGDYFDENGGLILFRDGVPTFKIVKGSDAGEVAQPLNELVEAVNKASKENIVVADAKSEPQDVEIIIGTVKTRGDEYNFRRYDLGEKGYIVKIVGSKIIVHGGNDASFKLAIKYLKENVFKITRSTPDYETFSMDLATNKEIIQNDYKVKSVKIADNDINDYVISYSSKDSAAKETAKEFQAALYTKVGVWLDIDTKATSGKRIIFRSIENDGKGLGYEAYVDDDSNLVFETEFAYMLKELATETYKEYITEPRGNTVSLDKGTVDTNDARNLYYEECGAKGDGVTNDFEYIKLAHDLANEHGHIVCGTPGATYYIGSTGGESAIVMTDVNWNGCHFIFDDSIIKSHNGAEGAKCTQKPCPDCADRLAAIFSVESHLDGVDVTSTFKGVSLKGGYGQDDNTQVIPNWPLDYLALVTIKDINRRVFVRVGENANPGSDQQELILVHPNGTIDPSTPLTYDYNVVTHAYAVNVDESYLPTITIDGGGALIENVANNPGDIVKNEYIAYSRNIAIYRSNVVVKNFHHRVINDQLYRGPYAGILYVNGCNNIEYRDITLQKHKARHISAVNAPGTYEIGGYGANDIRYYNVDSVNFFCDGAEDDFKSFSGVLYKKGEVAYRGIMGTNFIRNFHFEGCTLNSFDAHAGLGNVTIIDCIFEHINIQGSGKAIIKDTVIYADGALSVAKLRADYGSSWQGDVEIENVTMKYSKDYKAGNQYNELMVIGTNEYADYKDNDFDTIYNPETGKWEGGDGCYNYLPINISVKNLQVVKYEMVQFVEAVGYGGNSIIEREISRGGNVYLYDTSLRGYRDQDISLLKSESSYGVGLQNRVVGSETITVENCGNTNVIVPDSRNLMNCVYKVDGVLYTWNSNAAATESIWKASEETDGE